MSLADPIEQALLAEIREHPEGDRVEARQTRELIFAL